MNSTTAHTQQTEPREQADEEYVVLTPEEEEELERARAETREDIRAGRFYTLEEVLADLRKS